MEPSWNAAKDIKSTHDRPVFEQALDTALARLDETRAQAEELTRRLSTLQELEAHLHQTVTSLQVLLGPGVAGKEGTPVPALPGKSMLPAEPRTAVHKPEFVHEGPPLPQPRGMKRGVAPTSSPYLVGLILRESERPMTREEIVEDYLDRGWRDSKWQGDPKNNIYQAIRRATNYGWVRPLSGKKNVYVSTQLPDGHPATGEDLNTAVT